MGVSRGSRAQTAGDDKGRAEPTRFRPPLPHAGGRQASNRRTFPCGLWALQTHCESLLGSGWVCFLPCSAPGEEEVLRKQSCGDWGYVTR